MQGIESLDKFKNFVSSIGGLGRYEDTYIVHAAEGETVVPMEVFNRNPVLKERLFESMRDMGIEPERYVVGNELNSINPITGQPEFFLKNIGKFINRVMPGDSEKYLPIVSFSVVFIAIVIGVFIIGKIVEKFVNQINLSVINKIAGAGLGGAKVLLMMSFFITILNRYDQQFEFIPNEIKEESALYFPLCDLSKKVVPAVENSKAFKTGSEEIRDVVAER